jgi:hypothetical protein
MVVALLRVTGPGDEPSGRAYVANWFGVELTHLIMAFAFFNAALTSMASPSRFGQLCYFHCAHLSGLAS